MTDTTEPITEGQQYYRDQIAAACDYVGMALSQTLDRNLDVETLRTDLLELNHILWQLRYDEGTLPSVPRFSKAKPEAPVSPLKAVEPDD